MSILEVPIEIPLQRISKPPTIQPSRLIEELYRAVEHEDLETLDSKVDAWQYIMGEMVNSLQIWQELFLANPLAMAVRHKKEKVVEYLVKIKCLKLERPCKAMCKCSLSKIVRGDSRFHQLYTSRILTALLDWNYVFVASKTKPIDSCLKTWRAIKLSGLYNGYAREAMLDDLHSHAEATIIRCLDCTINENEVHVLLCKSAKKFINPMDSLKKIDSIVSADMKRAAIHPAIQSLITTHWTKDAHKLFGRRYRETKSLPFIMRVIVYLFVYLVIVPFSILFPHPKLINFLKSPTTVYANEALSYWTFFMVLTAQYFVDIPDNSYIICKTVPDPINYVIAVVMLARFVRTCDGIVRLGVDFFVSPYEMMQTISMCMYVTGVSMQMVATHGVPHRATVIRVCEDLAISKFAKFNVSRSDALRMLLDDQVGQCQAVKDFYNLGVHYVDFINQSIQPHNFASLFFAIGHLFYYLSAGNVLYMNRLVCHLNIAVTRMFADVVRWGFIMILFYFAWSLAMVSLYENFACENQAFSSVKNALLEMFWVLFAMTNTNDYQLSGILKSRNKLTTNIIEYTGFALYGSYYIIGQIVLVNLLIAIMSVTFQKIDEDRITEVTFWRSKIQLKYIFWHDVSALPSPFNLFYPIFWVTLRCWRFSKCYKDYVLRYEYKDAKDSTHTMIHDREKIVVNILNRSHALPEARDNQEIHGEAA